MLQYNQLKCKAGYSKEDIRAALSNKLNIPMEEILSVRILRESLDARKKPDIFYVLNVAFEVKQEARLKNRFGVIPYIEKTLKLPELNIEDIRDTRNPIVIGAGPAGLFCAYFLAKAGLKPLLLERGMPVEERTEDVSDFWETGQLNPKSNVQFGEGGAGTFSDGKLNTLNKDPFGYQKEVLKLFVQMGAKESILYEQRPHLGTDCLVDIVRNIRHAIIKQGGQVRFDAQVTDFLLSEGHDAIIGVVVNGQEKILADRVVLAVGHSARDTFRRLHKLNFPMEAKAFAVGYRVQHLQTEIDKSQYGEENIGKFPPASYKLTAQTDSGRGVYSFCMCPGGYVVNASSEDNRLCVNGMSYSDRSGQNANSAIIVSVSPEDFEGKDALAGVRFQENIEWKAYQVCDGKIPVQRFADFKNNKLSTEFGSVKPAIKGQFAFGNLRGIYTQGVEASFADAMRQFGRKIKGFDADDVLLAGVEPRTSSPIRIKRDEACQAVGIRGFYPCGEGAGYAGGIMSAACDGLRIAVKILESYQKCET